MENTFCLVMGQINTIVGDVAGNLNQVIHAAERARDEFNADLIVFPELTLTGYPPEDLLLRPGLMKRVVKAIEQLTISVRVIAVLVGHPAGDVRGQLFNAASFIADGRVIDTYH
jgi:NAD+ synthase (glutamine-hydrolysing)